MLLITDEATRTIKRFAKKATPEQKAVLAELLELRAHTIAIRLLKHKKALKWLSRHTARILIKRAKNKTAPK